MLEAFFYGEAWGIGWTLWIKAKGLQNPFEVTKKEPSSPCTAEKTTYVWITPNEVKYYPSLEDLFNKCKQVNNL